LGLAAEPRGGFGRTLRRLSCLGFARRSRLVSSRLVSFKPVPLPAIQPSRPAVSGVSSHVPPPRNTPLQPEFHTQGRLHLGKDGKTVDEAYICLSSGLGMCIIAWEAGVDGTWRNPLNMK
jgi:hypothetical protein